MSNVKIATRRELLTRGLGIVGVGATLPHFLIRTATASPPAVEDQRIMVIIQLSGGHDALSALVPHGNPEYGKVRKATRIADKDVIKINEELGLHPNLKGFKELLDEGAFAAVPGVGYPNPNYSHFTATDIWHTAGRDRTAQLGWVGKACDCAHPDSKEPALALAVGGGKGTRAIRGKIHSGLGFSRPESFGYSGARDKGRREAYRDLNTLAMKEAEGPLQYVAHTAVRANAASERIRDLASVYKSKVEYPETKLGAHLRTIGALIAGGMKTRVYYTFQGGFDTHRGQRERHDKLMSELNDAVMAFQRDMARQGQSKRLLTFTVSEFGRRVKENGSEGTDHGAASALFLFGEGITPGICGEHPSLTDLQGGGGGSLKHTVDFRSVYATVLEKWLSVPSKTVLGGAYPLLKFLA